MFTDLFCEVSYEPTKILLTWFRESEDNSDTIEQKLRVHR